MVRAGFHEGEANGVLKTMLTCSIRRPNCITRKTVVQVQAKFISKMRLHIKSLSSFNALFILVYK